MARTQKIKIINILLSSVDGKIATHDCESTENRRNLKFTNEVDFKILQKLTAKCDAVFIGAKSLECEKGAFRVAHLRADKKEPHWFVFTRSGTVNLEHDFWKQENIPKTLYQYTNVQDLKEFLNSLPKKNIKKIALLGGGKLNGIFWNEQLVDELYLTLSPFVVGQTNVPNLIDSNISIQKQLKLLKVQKIENFLFLHYKIK